MDNRSIGVFDSGLGGLTAVKELEKVLPGESIVYFGDTGRAPYGSRSRETVRRYARQDMAFLMRHNVKAVLAACGTVSSTCRDIGKALSVPYFDVIRPAAEAAREATISGRVKVIGTTATIRSGAFVKQLKRMESSLEVVDLDCPLFVPLVENGFVGPEDKITRLAVEHYLRETSWGCGDVVILGCTHYPLIAPIIQQVVGPEVKLIDSGREAARAVAEYLENHDMLCAPGTPRQVDYYVTDTPANFAHLAHIFLNHQVECQRVDDIESY